MANLRQVSTPEQVDREAGCIKRFLESEKEPVIIAWGTKEGMEVGGKNMKLVIPPQVQIGALTYKIIFNNKALAIADIRGQVNHTEQIIRLSEYGVYPTCETKRRSNTVIFEMLLHEVLHIQNYMWCGGELTEQQIEVLSAGLDQTLLSLGIEPDFSQIPNEE